VSTVYVDTSALGRVLLGESDKPAIKYRLDSFDQVVSSRLLRVELHRLGLRRNLLDAVDPLLDAVALIPLNESILAAAETAPSSTVATLDAIHLVTAIRLAGEDMLDAIMTYDKDLAAGAQEHGLTVLSPS
jgi:predicted nucleic acid-binding protein